MTKNNQLKSYTHLPWEERIREEKLCWNNNYKRVAGFDEAGRGPLAGPVVAAAFIITPGFEMPGLNDSKQLTAKQRHHFYLELTAGSYEYGIGIIEAEEIDKINIYQASRQAMLIALKALQLAPDYLLVDALAIPETPIPQRAIIHGDALSVAIAAASVIAKYTRDSIMEQYDVLYPGYGFAKHKGYPTREHYQALEKYGPLPIHRRSFRLTTPKDNRESMDLFSDAEVIEN
ncbi:MAG TPA: ribonuclease HII [Firmicutes bacterium]|nr:ribonuclease HII [Bacillota bacterium]